MFAKIKVLGLTLLVVLLAAMPAAAQDETTEVTLMLDWSPNTNHTGIYVAQAEGYFEEAGLTVEILEPSGDIPVEQIVGSGQAAFGISFQEWMTMSRAMEIPIVSVAAIIQHNTSGFATLAEKGVEGPGDLDGLTYGVMGSPVEVPLLAMLTQCDVEDKVVVEFVDIGYVDTLPLLEAGRIDIAWIFYAWDGLRAEVQGIDIDMLMLQDYADCVPDYYTPVLITNEQIIEEQPEVVDAFVGAVSRGYTWAIAHPDEAADILLEAVPELGESEELVRKGQVWLADQYQADAPRWGEQSPEVWEMFTAFMVDGGILEEPIDVDAAFTNAFLPPAEGETE